MLQRKISKALYWALLQIRHMGRHTRPTQQSQPAQEPALPYAQANSF